MGSALGVVLTTDVAIEGRAAVPVYVDESLPIVGPSRAVVLMPSDGSARLAGGPPMPVRLAPAGTPAIGPALPVYVIPGGGILDVQAYTNKVKALAAANLIAYWPQAEASGTTALDESGNGRTGAYTGVTLGATGIGDGRTAATYVAASSGRCNVYSASLNGAFNTAEGTIAGWFQVSAAGVWTDATNRYFIHLFADASNLVYIRRQTTNNQIAYVYIAGGTSKSFAATLSPTAWFHLALTWSKSADQMKGYVNGAQVGATQTGLGVWSGALASTNCLIGAQSTAGSGPWSGNGAHVAVWSTPLTAPQIAALAVVP